MDFNIKEQNIDGLDFLILTPTVSLTDKEYKKIKPYMEKMGGHWRERINGFAFLKSDLILDEEEQEKEIINFFKTPPKIANKVFSLSEINENSIILEPSAGDGALLEPIDKNILSKAFIIEPYKKNFISLTNKGYKPNFMTFEEFYKVYKSKKKVITNVIMNPPFINELLTSHIYMAYDLLAKDGVLVSVIKENILYSKDNESIKFQNWLSDCNAIIENLPYGSYKESGTTIDTCIIKIKKVKCINSLCS